MDLPGTSTVANGAASSIALAKKFKNTLPAFRVIKAQNLKTVVTSLVVLIVYLTVCTAVMTKLEPTWTITDGAYFAMVTMSTVGYGDISPSSDGARVWAICMIIVGVVFVFATVAGMVSLATGPITAKGRALLESWFPMQGVDIDGDGANDFYKPRPAPIYYLKNLMPSFLLTMVVQFGSAAIFHAIDPTHTFGRWLYHCVVTATTVGYGDTSNATQAGRVWACFHILLSVAMLGELISTLDELRAARAKTLARSEMLTTRLNGGMLDNLLDHAINLRPLVQRDGLGLTELEFCITMVRVQLRLRGPQ